MVLARALCAVLLVAGCKQSLFDNGGGGGDDTIDAHMPDSAVQMTCGADCLADLGADFCGTKLRCLDDLRSHMWNPMTASGADYVGANPANKIAMGTGGALVSTAGTSAPADPAISFVSTSKQVIRLSFSVDLPAGASTHVVRLYRNGREDVLYTAQGAGGANISTSITVDALDTDRFYLALAPIGSGATDIPVKFFVNTAAAFPQECELALTFEAATGTKIHNLCGTDLDSWDDTTSAVLVAPTLSASFFTELGTAGDLMVNHWYEGMDPIVRSTDTTFQAWVQHRGFGTETIAYVYGDADLDNGGGTSLYFYDNGPGLQVEADCCNLNTPPYTALYTTASFPNDHAWHFLRVVNTAGKVRLCVDGRKVGEFDAPAGALNTQQVPRVGRDKFSQPQGAFFNGKVDDLRIVKAALPCE